MFLIRKLHIVIHGCICEILQIQARYADAEEWILQKYIQINDPEITVYLNSGAESFSDVRVILCLQSNQSWCGDAKIASPFDG